MCVILFSPKGVEAPTEEQIEKAFAKNPDGAGFAYCDKHDHNKVKFEKGFMTVEALIKRLKPLEQWTDTNLAIHFRIGTAGKNDEKTCHPFRISTKFKDLQQLSGEGAVLFHNGVLAQGGLADPLSSDTQDFVIAYAPLFEKYNKSKTRDAFIENAVTGSRVLVMYDDNKVKMYGKWEKSDEGNLLVSNKYWEHVYSYAYSYDYYDDYKPYSATTTKATTTKATSLSSSATSTSKSDFVLTEYTKREVEEQWDKLWRNDYIWFDDIEMFDAMLDSADEIEGDYVTKDGVTYVFDEESMTAWNTKLDDYKNYV